VYGSSSILIVTIRSRISFGNVGIAVRVIAFCFKIFAGYFKRSCRVLSLGVKGEESV